ncbi:kinase-like domain, phloem protein 2-like protein [Tanacetum coccineum]
MHTMMSSVNHDDLAHLKISLDDVLSATSNFDDENVVGEDGFGNYYKGQLLLSGELINILAERLNKEWFDGHQQFWTEVSLLSTLKHKNLVSLVGFCDDNDEKVIICKPLSYIHYDESRDFSVIHRNINSGSVYLNDDWEPKLGDFIGSMKIKASERHQSFNIDKVWISTTDGYTDPTYIEEKMANHKSDMYSFGIVMFELLCGRRAVNMVDQDNKYLALLAITHYREKKLNEIIDWDLWNQMDSQSFDIFAEIAYDCLKEERSQRPNIDEIVPKLEKALKHARENKPVRHLLFSSIFLS